MSATEPAHAKPLCVWDLGCELGEGPVWIAAEAAMWFVDIKGACVHRYHPATGEQRSWTTPSAPGFVAPLAGGKFLVGLKSGLHRFDPTAREPVFERLYGVEPHLPGNRLNDGAVDSHGRLWFGSMDDGETQASGCLYRLGVGGPVVMDDGYVITNGPAFSPDGRLLYHTDTLAKTIYAFDVDSAGEIGGKRVFARIEDGGGYPDGPTVDAEGCVWTGLFGGWSVRRYAPSGELLQTVQFPCANVTKIAFGGEDLRTVYATTAWKGLSKSDREGQPLAGGLFAFRTQVPGLPSVEVSHGV